MAQSAISFRWTSGKIVKFFIISIVVFLTFSSIYYSNPLRLLENVPLVGPSIEDSIQLGEGGKLRLRLDWTNLQPLSPLAKTMSIHQRSSCHLPMANFHNRNCCGLGSDLHVWSQALCNGLEQGLRVRSNFPWIWWDNETCTNASNSFGNDMKLKISSSAMVCYFPNSELECPGDNTLLNSIDLNLTKEGGLVNYECPKLIDQYGISQIRAASMEFLFTRVAPVVQAEGLRQLSIVFGNLGFVPKNLIAVQIRWGDKNIEMELVPIDEYISAVHRLVNDRSNNTVDDINILLLTEDPKAVTAFKEAAPISWSIFVDAFFYEMLPHRRDEYFGNPHVASSMNGKPGLIALGSILVAMEANDFILTTGSNWSRLINELRKNILDPRCDNCTRMIDLREGEY